MTGNERVNPFTQGDDDDSLSDFRPKTGPATAPSKEDIDAIAESAGFPSRQPKAKDSSRPILRRRRTGRTFQINIKTTQLASDRFYAIVDETEKTMGEIFELALEALEEKLKQGKLS